MRLRISILCACFLNAVPVSAQPALLAASEQRVDANLFAHQQSLVANLKKIGSRVYGAEFMGYSNFGFIDTSEGIVVVDAGWFPGPTAQAVRLLREKTSKPVVAIIYTHLHVDHYGGIRSIMAGQPQDVPVYGPKNWQAWFANSQGIQQKTIFRRAFLQMGIVIPEGLDGTVGNGIGPSPRLEVFDDLSFPPTIEIESATQIVIGDVTIELIPAEGDLNENLWVWLPDERVLFVGDSPPHGVFPAVETARFEIERDAFLMMESVGEAIALDPLYIIPGHSRILDDIGEIKEIMGLTRDAIQFLIDQVDRFYLSDRSIDDLLETIHLPPAIAKHPDLQPYYHRWEWMMQQRFIKKSGFIDDWMDYMALTTYEEARRLVPLMGGTDIVLKAAIENLETDPRWAAQLATYILLTDPDDAAARSIRQRASIRVAQTTKSANQRNYLFGLVAEERNRVDFDKILQGPIINSLVKRDDKELLNRLRSRLVAEKADNVKLRIRVQIDSEGSYDLVISNNILRLFNPEKDAALNATWSLPRKLLIEIVARQKNLTESLESGDLLTAGSYSDSAVFASLIE